MNPRLKELYNKEIKINLKDKFGYKNTYMVPEIKKIILNMGLGLDGNDAKILKSCQDDLAQITGQKPVITKFKKSISNFKTRKSTNAGLKVTLRKNIMYEFIDRLVNIALPRIIEEKMLLLLRQGRRHGAVGKIDLVEVGHQSQIEILGDARSLRKVEPPALRALALVLYRELLRPIFRNGNLNSVTGLRVVGDLPTIQLQGKLVQHSSTGRKR